MVWASGLLREQAGTSWALRPRELGQARREWVGPRRKRVELGFAGLGLSLGWFFFFSISIYSLFSNLIQTSLNSNKKNLNSNHTQLKVCTSMNAQQI